MFKVDLVIQGPITQFTPEVFNHYLGVKEFDRIILSCWEGEDTRFVSATSKVTVVKSNRSLIPKVGGGNVNLQLQTSLTGTLESTADIVLKVRTDMQICEKDLTKLVRFLLTKGYTTFPKLDGTRPLGKIVVGSIFTEFPYHPRDHFYLGYRKDLLELFSAPPSPQDFLIPNTILGIRPEAYIGAHYCSKFSNEALQHIGNPHMFITDRAPMKIQADLLSSKLIPEVFLPSPKVNHIWKKHGVYSYKPLCSPAFKEVFSEAWE